MARDASAALIGGVTRELLQIAMMSVTLVLLSPRLFAIFVGGIAPLWLLLQKLGKKLKQRATASLANYAAMTEWIQQRLLGIETIKHYHTEKLEQDKFSQLSHTQFKTFLRSGKMHVLIPQVTEALTVVAMAVALYFALQELRHSSTAVVLAFFSTLALLAQSASRIGRYFGQSREGDAAVTRIFALKEELEQSTCVAPLLVTASGASNTLVCDNITVQLAQQQVLRNFAYRFEGGILYGLRGVVGAGKSTLLKAILGLLPLQDGRIFLQLKDGKGEGRAMWLPQKLQLRAGDVASNVCYPHTEVDNARLKQALTYACVPQEKWHSTIDYDTAPLSGGQEQRLGLARLFYHPAPLVLIDEGTAALDQQTEQQVLHHLKTLTQRGTIVIMAAHRRAALAVCDRIVEISPVSSIS